MSDAPAAPSAERATVRAVVAYAERLRAEAEAAMLADPYARPYYPTTAGARKLYERVRAERVREAEERRALPPEDPHAFTVEQADAHVAGAAEAAIERLRARAALTAGEERDANEQADRAAKRHERRQAQARRDVEAARRGLTLGQRLDEVLAALGTMSAVAAAAIDGDVVSGGKPGSRPPAWVADAHGKARERALRLVQDLETDLDHARGAAGAPPRRQEAA